VWFAVDNNTACNDGLVSEVLTIGERHVLLVYTTAYTHTPYQLLIGSCSRDASVAMVVT
jgi:sporulation-control protein spo0M